MTVLMTMTHQFIDSHYKGTVQCTLLVFCTAVESHESKSGHFGDKSFYVMALRLTRTRRKYTKLTQNKLTIAKITHKPNRRTVKIIFHLIHQTIIIAAQIFSTEL